MNIKKVLAFGGLCTVGLGIAISLPLALSSCSNTTADENPISFSGVEQAVNPNQAVTINANVENADQYQFVWSY